MKLIDAAEDFFRAWECDASQEARALQVWLREHVSPANWRREAYMADQRQQTLRLSVERKAVRARRGVPQIERIAEVSEAIQRVLSPIPNLPVRPLHMSRALHAELPSISAEHTRRLLRVMADEGHPCYDPAVKCWRLTVKEPSQ